MDLIASNLEVPSPGAQPSDFPFALIHPPGRSVEAIAEDIDQALNEIDEHLRHITTKASFSSLFRMQLAWNKLRKYSTYSGKPCLFDVRCILHEIAHLENRYCPTRTKQQRELIGSLSGFWHKHFYDNQFLLRNLIEEVGNKNSYNRLWHRDFSRDHKKLTGNPWQGATIDDDVAGLIAHSLTIGAWEERSGSRSRTASSRVTGEWIVYAEEAGRRVYLTLALHAEPTSSIVARLRQTAEEFPFVSDRLDEAAVNLAP